MAISAHETPVTLQVLANTPRRDCMTLGKHTKIDIDGDRILDNAKRRVKQRAPFLRSDKIQMLSRVTEKRYVHGPSHPMALNIYKANSDEFKTPRRVKKMKKSVHTLPNDPAPMPQSCTVSDMNDSEYYYREDEKAQTKPRKKAQSRKNRTRRRNYEYYDRDAQHCSDLECSSTEIINNYGGDGKRHIKSKDINVKTRNDYTTSQDMWTVLRNINKFKFRPSARISDDSLGLSSKKRSTFAKKHTNLSNGRRLIETCRTAEVSYVANFEFNGNNLPQINVSPSISRITVIEQNKIKPKCDTIQNMFKMVKPRSPLTIPDRDYNINNPSPTNFKAVAIREFNKYVPISKCIPEIKAINTKYKNSSTISGDSSNCLRSKENSRVTETMEQCIMDTGHLIENEEELGTNQVFSQRSRQVTVVPKLTKAEIRRRLCQLKYPLVVLGKDQICSFVEISDYDPPQFDGLDKHIWPFMTEWTKNGLIEQGTNNLSKMSLEVHKKPNNTREQSGNKKSENKRFPQQGENTTQQLTPKKPKPIRHFKDKMLRFLYKNSSTSDAEGNKETKYAKTEKIDACTEPIFEVLVDPGKQKENLNSMEKKQGLFILPYPKKPKEIFNSIDKQSKNIFVPKRQRPYPGKVEYANGTKSDHWDFINNIIKKIKNGVYYTEDEKKSSTKHDEVRFIGNLIEASPDDDITSDDDIGVQLNGICNRNDFTLPSNALSVINDNESLHLSSLEIDDTIDVKIPGFDDDVDILRDIEINSLTFNKIAIKHRLTNVIVQFDLTLPTKSRDKVLDVKNSSFVPITVGENNTKVFKCNTKIFNAILPAELCCLIPSLMRDFIDTKPHLTIFPAVPPAVEVQEIACATSDLFLLRQVDPHSVLGLYDIPNTISYLILSPVLRTALNWGKFAIKILKPCTSFALEKYNKKHMLSMADVTKLLPVLPSPIPIFLCIVSPLDYLMPKANCEEQRQSTDRNSNPSNSKALQVHEQYVYLLYGTAYSRLMEAMRKYYTFNLTFYLPPCLNPLTVKCDMLLTEIERLKGSISITVSNMQLESISSRFLNMKINGVKNAPQIDFGSTAYYKVMTEILPIEAKQSQVVSPLPEINLIRENPDIVYDAHYKTGKKEQKFRKHRYFKFYNKCKSTTNLSGERSCTALSKITNLDEFFQALGSAKTFSTVFDGSCGKKIMAAIVQLKTWISDLTPRQAMLVLLLTNKKDTPNLIRFRPVLLQGIAVNRITRATELDMEIEVIETENVGLTKEVKLFEKNYEGISYVPASIENQDSLLEELCWIAKNTASDYQKTFDESSEKLLKSLIEKRKKLNPSYLRVVARYVGLGLLKRKN